MMLCLCGCGQETRLATQTDSRISVLKGQPNKFVHGHQSVKHNLSESPEYDAYHNALRHCTNPKDKKWKNYGGRGIEFRFINFEQFFAEVGPRPSPTHSLDRKNNNGHYEPGNIRWATRSEQQRNQRRRLAIESFPTEILIAELKRRNAF
jgi:hypothetical protein